MNYKRNLPSEKIDSLLNLIKEKGLIQANSKQELAKEIGTYSSLVNYIIGFILKAEKYYKEKTRYSDFFYKEIRDEDEGCKILFLGYKGHEKYSEITSGVHIKMVPCYIENKMVEKKLIDNEKTSK